MASAPASRLAAEEKHRAASSDPAPLMFAELLPNLRQLVVAIALQKGGKVPKIRMVGNALTIAWEAAAAATTLNSAEGGEGGYTFKLNLGCKLDARKTSVRAIRGQSLVYVKIPLERNAMLPSPMRVPYSWELDPSQVSTLYCRTCGNRLSRNKPREILPLPSPHWMELTDLWYCAGRESSSLLAKVAEAPLKATPGKWLVGSIDILIHSEDINSHSIIRHMPKRGRDEDEVWAPVTCRRCRALIGSQQIVEEPSKRKKQPSPSSSQLPSSSWPTELTIASSVIANPGRSSDDDAWTSSNLRIEKSCISTADSLDLTLPTVVPVVRPHGAVRSLNRSKLQPKPPQGITKKGGGAESAPKTTPDILRRAECCPGNRCLSRARMRYVVDRDEEQGERKGSRGLEIRDYAKAKVENNWPCWLEIYGEL
eukprot:jgi/Bigna1/146699/aug1.119_g21407